MLHAFLRIVCVTISMQYTGLTPLHRSIPCFDCLVVLLVRVRFKLLWIIVGSANPQGVILDLNAAPFSNGRRYMLSSSQRQHVEVFSMWLSGSVCNFCIYPQHVPQFYLKHPEPCLASGPKHALFLLFRLMYTIIFLKQYVYLSLFFLLWGGGAGAGWGRRNMLFRELWFPVRSLAFVLHDAKQTTNCLAQELLKSDWVTGSSGSKVLVSLAQTLRCKIHCPESAKKSPERERIDMRALKATPCLCSLLSFG